jgi:hypothetical protein
MAWVVMMLHSFSVGLGHGHSSRKVYPSAALLDKPDSGTRRFNSSLSYLRRLPTWYQSSSAQLVSREVAIHSKGSGFGWIVDEEK